jgi:hypothetical protein
MYAGNMPTIAKDPTGEFFWIVAIVTAAAVFFTSQTLDCPSGPTWDPKEVKSAYVSIATAPIGGGLVGRGTSVVVGGGLRSLGVAAKVADPVARVFGASAAGATSSEIGLFAERGIVEERLPTTDEAKWAAIVGAGLGGLGQAGAEGWQAWRGSRNAPKLAVKPAPKSKLYGISDEEANGLGNYLKSLTIDGKRAVKEVEAYGSRAGSVYEGVKPSSASDLDVFITLNNDAVNSPDKLRAITDEIQEVAKVLKGAKGMKYDFNIQIEAVAEDAKKRLLDTPFIKLGN